MSDTPTADPLYVITNGEFFGWSAEIRDGDIIQGRGEGNRGWDDYRILTTGQDAKEAAELVLSPCGEPYRIVRLSACSGFRVILSR